MSEYRDSTSNNLLSLISGAFIGAAGLAWYLFSEADKRKETKKQKAMMYSSRIQDGSEALDANENRNEIKSDNLEQKVEQLNSAIADVRRQLEELGQ
tara:strand:- start:4160 stop:4450 length:291 start_codon:yes stop_codon:yes gene_type:complete